MWRRTDRAALGARLAVPLLAACTPDRREEPPPAPSRDVAAWDFDVSDATPPGSVALWPRGPGAPERKKRQLDTEDRDGRLATVVTGQDPCFLWQFEAPRHLTGLRLEVEAERPGSLQLFTTHDGCPTLSEACSAKAQLEAGRQTLTFFLDQRVATRELRLDLPEDPGARVSFDSIRAGTGAAPGTPWTGRAEITDAHLGPAGLILSSSTSDPWMTTSTPGLEARWVTTVEVTVRGPSGPPQLYWDGPCPVFSEECSVRLSPADAGALTHRADLHASRRWSGRIEHLRLDPGPSAGTYRVERVALTAEAGQKPTGL